MIAKGRLIDWGAVGDDLGIQQDAHLSDAEPCIHEIAHMYDCLGEEAFDFVGSGTHVEKAIIRKYGSASCEAANVAEVWVAAVTQTTMELLGILTPLEKRDIMTALYENLRGDWFQNHPGEEVERLFHHALGHSDVQLTAAKLAQFLTQSFPAEPSHPV